MPKRAAPGAVPTTVAPKTGYHHKNLRNALIESGKSLLEAGGLPAFSLRQAARTAGVSQTAPYHHFSDKDALLAAIAADGFERLARELEGAEGLDALMRAFLRFARSQPQMFRLMFGTDPAAQVGRQDLRTGFERCWAVFAEATARYLGEPSADTPRARQSATAMWSALYGLSRLSIDAIAPRGAAPDETAEALVHILHHGIERTVHAPA